MPSGQKLSSIEIWALVASALWIGLVVFLNLNATPSEGGLNLLWRISGVLIPLAMIWVVALMARTIRAFRAEAAELRAAINGLRQTSLAASSNPEFELRGERAQAPVLKSAIAQELSTPPTVKQSADPAPVETDTAPPIVFSTNRREDEAEVVKARAAVDSTPEADDTPPQSSLAFEEDEAPEEIALPDLFRALNFPDDENDKEGFAALRLALENPSSERLVRASQDVLTLLSEDGIYMDDLAFDRAKPEVWRRFAEGERGAAVADLGGIHDKTVMAMSANRMRKDPVFRDAAHHFLRHFDYRLMEIEPECSDEELSHFADTRTARAFMLLGRVAGTFD